MLPPESVLWPVLDYMPTVKEYLRRTCFVVKAELIKRCIVQFARICDGDSIVCYIICYILINLCRYVGMNVVAKVLSQSGPVGSL